MSVAAFLAPPPRPPHDPLWIDLGPATGWRLAASSAPAVAPLREDPASGDLVLPFAPGEGRVLGEASGSLGGLVVPGNMAIDAAGNLWLLDRGRRRLLVFDVCDCTFREAACAGLALVDPRAIACDRGRLYIVDAGRPGRLLVLDPQAVVLRAIWQPPSSALAAPWQPTAVAIRQSEVLVADAANGALHRFAPWGGWRDALTDVGAYSRLALDDDGRIYGVVADRDDIDLRRPDGTLIGRPSDPAAVAAHFPEATIPTGRKGEIDLSGHCPGAGWFGPDGKRLDGPQDTAPTFAASASATTAALDSRIARCQWHRVVLGATRVASGAITIETTTAETELTDPEVAALPPFAWQKVPLAGSADEALILSPPGRFLWARITLSGDGAATARLSRLTIEYPRISLRRYLPAAFGADPVSAGFLDRFLGNFDRGLRDLEAKVDRQAELFDPRTTPAAPGRDMLGWLAGWIGVTLDRRWSEAVRRRMVRAAASLFACRGTLAGLRGAILLWLGWDRLDGLTRSRGPCEPDCAPPKPCPPMPQLVLEHWRLRRWLFLGAGRLGDAAVLWGSKILGRSQLDAGARTGATRLDTIKDPLRDPFHHDAHRVSVFVPARAVATPGARSAFRQLLAQQIPAHVEARLVPVAPRMRIGIQASLGFDTVVGCWPPSLTEPGLTLGSARLGRASVLPGAAGSHTLPPRLGRDSRLRGGAAYSSPPNREASP